MTAAEAEASYPLEARVEIHSIVKAPELNGKAGIVKSAKNSNGRQVVYVESLDRQVALKPANLRYEPRSLDSLSVKELKALLKHAHHDDSKEVRGAVVDKAELRTMVSDAIGSISDDGVEIAKMLAKVNAPKAANKSSSASSTSASSFNMPPPSQAADMMSQLSPEQLRQQAQMMRSLPPATLRQMNPQLANLSDRQIQQAADQMEMMASNPSMMKMAEQQMRNMSPDDMQRMQQQVMMNSGDAVIGSTTTAPSASGSASTTPSAAETTTTTTTASSSRSSATGSNTSSLTSANETPSMPAMPTSPSTATADAANVMANMTPEQLRQQAQMMRTIPPDQLRQMNPQLSQMTDEQIQMAASQFEIMANNPSMMKMAMDQMRNMSDDDMQRMQQQMNATTTATTTTTAGRGEGGNAAANGSAAGLPADFGASGGSAPDPTTKMLENMDAKQLKGMLGTMKDNPTMLKQMAQMTGVSEDSLKSGLDQFSGMSDTQMDTALAVLAKAQKAKDVWSTADKKFFGGHLTKIVIVVVVLLLLLLGAMIVWRFWFAAATISATTSKAIIPDDLPVPVLFADDEDEFATTITPSNEL